MIEYKQILLNQIPLQLKDVTKLVKEKLNFLKEEKDGYMLYFTLKLLDCSIHQVVLSDAEKVSVENFLCKRLPLKVHRDACVH